MRYSDYTISRPSQVESAPRGWAGETPPIGPYALRHAFEAYGMARAALLTRAEKRQARHEYAAEFGGSTGRMPRERAIRLAHTQWASAQPYPFITDRPPDWSYSERTAAEIRGQIPDGDDDSEVVADPYDCRHALRRKVTIAVADKWVGRIYGMAGSAERTRQYRNRQKAQKDKDADVIT
jgi:hypothetical protein